MTRCGPIAAACGALVLAGSAHAADEPKDPALVAAELQKAQADARQAAATADKAEVDARKAALDFRTAERDANQKLLPNSGKSSSVTAKEAAGQVEAALLANRELANLTATAAASISRAIDTSCGGCDRRKVIILTSGEDIALAHLRMFELRRDVVAKAMNRANEAYAAALSEAQGRAAPGAFIVGPALATTVVQLANLASYFASSSEVGGIEVTPNDRALIAALAKSLQLTSSANHVYLASRTGTPGATRAVTAELNGLDDLAFTTATHLADAKTRAAAARKGKKGDAADAAAKPWDDAAGNLSKAIEGYNAFIALLADEKGGLPLSTVLRERALGDLLSDPSNVYQVIPTYVTAGGGYYTQTNLWTVGLGVVPFHVSGGSAIAYEVLRADTGESIDGGTVEGESSYIAVRKVAERLRTSKAYAVTRPPKLLGKEK